MSSTGTVVDKLQSKFYHISAYSAALIKSSVNPKIISLKKRAILPMNVLYSLYIAKNLADYYSTCTLSIVTVLCLKEKMQTHYLYSQIYSSFYFR